MSLTKEKISEIFSLIPEEDFLEVLNDMISINHFIKYTDSTNDEDFDIIRCTFTHFSNLLMLTKMYKKHDSTFKSLMKLLDDDKKLSPSEDL